MQKIRTNDSRNTPELAPARQYPCMNVLRFDLAIAIGGDKHGAGLPRVPIQACPAQATRDGDLRPAARYDVISQRQSPVIPSPTGLVETAGVHLQETLGRVGAGGHEGLRRGAPLA